MKKPSKVVLSGLVVAGLVGVSLSLSSAANAASVVPAPNPPSDKPIYVLDFNTATQSLENQTYFWNDDFLLSPNPTDQNASYAAPPAGTAFEYEFISPRGSERSYNAWNAYAAIGQTDTLAAFDGEVSGLTTGNSSASPSTTVGVATTGGDYALGIAYTDKYHHVLEADYVNVTFTANSNPAKATFQFSGGAAAAPVQTTPDFSTYAATSGVSAVIHGSNLVVTGGSALAGKTADLWVEGASTAASTGVVFDSSGNAILSGLPTGVADGKRLAFVATGTVTPVLAWTATTTYVRSVPTDTSTKVTIANPAQGAATVSVALGSSNAGKTFYAYGFSTPVSLGNVTADTSGNVTVNVGSLPAGAHTIAIYDANDNVIAWGTITIPASAYNQVVTQQLQVEANNTGKFALEGTLAPIDFGTVNRGVTSPVKSFGPVKVTDDSDTLTGWKVTAKVDPFVNGSLTIPNTALGLTPKYVADSTVSTASAATISLGAAQVAGAATYDATFAEASSGSDAAINGANFTGDLAFKVPTNATKGTYSSTLTLTLVKK